MTAGEMLMMASLRDPYAAAAAGVGMLAASQLAQLNQLMIQQQQQQQHALQLQQSPHGPSQAASSMGGPAMGTPLGTPLGMGSPPECQSPPISRTYTYKKVTKPLLERKRRARINRCLDELKELMVGALEAEGENVSKLEKADILELTVRHLQRITKPRDAAEDASRFQAGFSQCASEACHFLLGLPGLDEGVGRRLVAHLGQVVTQVGIGGLGGLPLGQGLAGLGGASPPGALRPSSAGSVYSPPASPDQLGGALDHEQGPHGPGQRAGPSPGPGAAPTPAQLAQLAHLAAGAATRASRSPSLQSGRDSPRDDAEGEVSSTSTSSGGWPRGRAPKRPRSQRDSEAEDSEDDDVDADSDAPVNYSTEALRRQPSKQPRYEDLKAEAEAAAARVLQALPSTAAAADRDRAPGAAGAGWMGHKAGMSHASRGSPDCSYSCSGSGSEDESRHGGPSGSASTWRPW